MVLAEKYANGITWNGDNSLVEYLDARAVRSYENYYYERKEVFQSQKWFDYVSDRMDEQTDADTMIKQFVFGIEDIFSDKVWENFRNEVKQNE